MYIVPSWGELPQLVLTNIYSHLNNAERLSAASSCWHWRNALFQPRFFEKVTFQVCRERETKNAFLVSVGHLCNAIAIWFNPQTLFGVQKTADILKKIKSNNCAQRLILRPKYSSFLLVHYRNFLELIEAFLTKRQFPLRELDLGGMESLSLHANELLSAIHCSDYVQSLGLATVKNEPSYYLVQPLSPTLSIARFPNLKKLSLDYDYFSDEWLVVFEGLRFLRDVIIHVHGLEEDSHPGTSNEAWGRLTAKNPALRLHLTLIHAYDAAHLLQSHILCPAMPLSHLKILFCEHLNTAAIEFLSNYAATLKSVVWVDVVRSMDFYEDYDQDQLVMLAWRCKLLRELVLNGYAMDPHNLIGIARLRGDDLLRLEVSDVEWSAELCEEIGKQLGRVWTPLPKTILNSIFVNDGRFNLQLQNEYVMRCVQESFASAGNDN